jgi:two-component system NtrC family response regulator
MILIADDDPSVVASLGLLLKRHGYATVGAQSQEEALRCLEKEGDGVVLVLQDMNFSRGTGGEEGLDLLREIRQRRPHLPVILITAWGSIALAVEGMKAGAADFVTKPWNNAQILQSVETALSLARSEEPQAAPASREELDRRFDFSALIGRDPRFLKILELIGRIAPTDASVLITGESGTGKELVAEAIHGNSRRQAGPFIKVNLGGISSTLFESELFGHVKGAFTDARANRKGRFELAHGGTVFLDEIGELDLSAQVKLLRVLQDRSYEVLGSSVTRTVDMRVVSATNRDLGEQVAKGRFREDLLYRLNLIAIHLPPLKERRGDIPLLASQFLEASSRIYRGGEGVTISDRAMAWLRAQSWPGNIRQLRQTLERAVLVLDGNVLDVNDLRALSDLESRAASDPNALPPPGSMTLDEMEKAMIVKCMQHFEGNVTRVAQALGLSRAALYRRFEKYGLQP